MFLYKTSIKKVYNKNNTYWVVSCIALYLGAWWALQEGSWGGWWNWDSSEVFGLIVLTFILFIIHFYTIYSSLIYKNYIFFNWIILLLFFYTILQMSYTLVSHNFGLNILDYGYVNTNFLLVTVLILMFYVLTHYILYINIIYNWIKTNGVYINYHKRYKVYISMSQLNKSIYMCLKYNPWVNYQWVGG
jgi:hypothetical protein